MTTTIGWSEEDLVELLKEEDRLRRSEDYQKKMTTYEESVDTEWMDVATEIQTRVVTEYMTRLNPCLEPSIVEINAGLKQLRRAARRHPEICHYVKYNRARDCPIQVNSFAPDLPMLRVRGSQTEPEFLLSRKQEERELPLVLIAGSIS